MIAYGDPQQTASVETIERELHAKAGAAHDIDLCRALLIFAGQIEQAVVDLGLETSAPEHLTDHCARLFCALFFDGNADRELRSSIEPAWKKVRDCLNRSNVRELSFKVPEGFAFYSLYPEQYCVSAVAWSTRQPTRDNRAAMVIGVRSIGTTLSAVVAESLRRSGWTAERQTVRPCGHPYAREALLRAGLVRAGRQYLIVDEGPGRSGSSMASVVAALRERGAAPEAICFMPAHSRGPGEDASAAVRALWSSTACVVTPLAEVRWRGASLQEVLMSGTAGLLGEAPRTLLEAGAGAWRQFAYSKRSDWPAVPKAFDRPKLLAELPSGRALLKFTGFGIVPHLSRPAVPTTVGGIRPVLPRGEVAGWSVFPWIEGSRLRRSELVAVTSRQLAMHLRSMPGAALPDGERAAAFYRLEQMLRFNASQALGSVGADRVESLISAARASGAGTGDAVSVGDARFAPCDFIRSGRDLWRPLGSSLDHTIAGLQPLIWSVAAFSVERGTGVSFGLEVLRACGDARPSPAALRFYQAAYAALRLGMFAMSGGSEEQRRDARAMAFYRRALERSLAPDSKARAMERPEDSSEPGVTRQHHAAAM